MEYSLECNETRFAIRQEPLGMWDLWVNDQPTLTFATPEEAAQAVYQQNTAFYSWDSLETHNAPEGIDGWVKTE